MLASRSAAWCLRAATLTLALGALSACGEPGADDLSTATEENRVVFDVDWKPSTTVLFADTLEDAGAQLAGDTVTLERALPAFEALAPGDLAVLEGLGVFEVAAALTEAPGGSQHELEVRSSSLLEAAERGDIEWDLTVEAGTAVVLPTAEADPDWKLAPQRDKDKDSTSFSGTLRGTELKLELSYEGSTTEMSFEAKVPSAIPYKAKGSAKMEGLRVTGSLEFSEGSLDALRYQIRDFRLTVDLEAEGGGESFDQQLAVPIALYFPVSINLLPAYVGLGGEVNVRASASPRDQGRIVGSFVISGSTGIERTPEGSFTHVGSAKADRMEASLASFDAANSSGVGTTLDFPRIDFGIGLVTKLSKTAPPVSAGVFAKFKTEALHNVRMRVEDGEKLWCLEKKANAGVHYGGQIKALGFGLEREAALWSRFSDPVRSGPGCN